MCIEVENPLENSVNRTKLEKNGWSIELCVNKCIYVSI